MSKCAIGLMIAFGLLLLKMERAEAKCNCNCPLNYAPVCAEDRASKDRDTFNNECMLQCYNCTHDKNYKILFRAACGEVNKKQKNSRSKLPMP